MTPVSQRAGRRAAKSVGLLVCVLPACAGAVGERERLASVVETAVRGPILDACDVPGMVVGITVRGERSFFSDGVASRATGRPVNADTVFEVGSITKVFTATLAAYAAERDLLALTDTASSRLPAFSGTAFDDIRLGDLVTYTSGGLPLQFPSEVTDQASMVAWFRAWRPSQAAGTHRLYSNPSIGLCGLAVAASMGQPFDQAMQDLIAKLGLTRTSVGVPPERIADAADGCSADGTSIHLTPGVLAAPSYGIQSSAADLVHLLEAVMDGGGLAPDLQRAIAATKRPRYAVGAMLQALGWEAYVYPASLDALLAGNSADVIFGSCPVAPVPPLSAADVLLFNKTGSTNGFGAYVVMVPAHGIGIVLLANRNYPIAVRVTAAHRILAALDS